MTKTACGLAELLCPIESTDMLSHECRALGACCAGDRPEPALHADPDVFADHQSATHQKQVSYPLVVRASLAELGICKHASQ